MCKCKDCACFVPKLWCSEFAEEVSEDYSCELIEENMIDEDGKKTCDNCELCMENWCNEFAEEVDPEKEHNDCFVEDL